MDASAKTPSGFFHACVAGIRSEIAVATPQRMIEPMAFPDSILTDGETIVRQFRPHWRMLAIPVLWFLAAIVAIGLVYGALPPDDGTADLITTGVIVLAMLALVVGPVLKWWFTLYALTTERLITRTGIIARRGIEIPLQNINNVLFNQSVFERLVGAGDLLIESGGEAGQQRFTDIRQPDRVQNQIHSQMEVNESRRFQGPASGADVA